MSTHSAHICRIFTAPFLNFTRHFITRQERSKALPIPQQFHMSRVQFHMSRKWPAKLNLDSNRCTEDSKALECTAELFAKMCTILLETNALWLTARPNSTAQRIFCALYKYEYHSLRNYALCIEKHCRTCKMLTNRFWLAN